MRPLGSTRNGRPDTSNTHKNSHKILTHTLVKEEARLATAAYLLHPGASCPRLCASLLSIHHQPRCHEKSKAQELVAVADCRLNKDRDHSFMFDRLILCLLPTLSLKVYFFDLVVTSPS
jgi:hypothetical protein